MAGSLRAGVGSFEFGGDVRQNGKLLVRGTCSDNGVVKGVSVNGVAARAARDNFAEWEVELPAAETKLTATAADGAGNAEKTPHVVAVGR